MNNLNQGKRFIFTGAPGSRKTSVIVALEKLGHALIHEAATDVAKGIENPQEEPDFADQINSYAKRAADEFYRKYSVLRPFTFLHLCSW